MIRPHRFRVGHHQAEDEALNRAQRIASLIQIPEITLEALRRAYDMAVSGRGSEGRNRQPQRQNPDDVSSSYHLHLRRPDPHRG
jgi:hypothetical protein